MTLLTIKKETKGFLVAIVRKLLEKCSLNYKLIRNMEWLSPLKVIENSRVCIDQLTRCLQVMCNAERLRADKCDKAIAEYQNFLEENKEVIADYDGGRLYQFFFSLHLSTTSACENLWVVANKVLLLSLGQASVERGFSVNKNLSTDMEAKSIISKCIIVGYVRSVSKVVNVRIDKELLR